ncbi:hypothetical protein GWI33_012772 [Rhynchophorus ferrugineus]|uniref:Uncharacterized protein n=1 Tax=Rhynchophorus ferrugineus TaxID=354439 RepID=A0A834I505_RHYFE|nr:hypothetical protein GWI33_012772 [Rhynchophorus ferrugineus]
MRDCPLRDVINHGRFHVGDPWKETVRSFYLRGRDDDPVREPLIFARRSCLSGVRAATAPPVGPPRLTAARPLQAGPVGPRIPDSPEVSAVCNDEYAWTPDLGSLPIQQGDFKR